MSLTRSEARKRYHHGDLRNALLAEAESLLKAEGGAAITLRAVARAAGVSHAAPANHFHDLTGLLSDLAAIGYTRFATMLAAAARHGAPEARRLAMGRAYVGFAKANPEMFALMFHHKGLDPDRPTLAEGIQAARIALRSITATPQAEISDSKRAAAQAAALWSIVHGFATLLIDGRLDNLTRNFPGKHGEDRLFDAVMASVTIT